MLPQRETVTLDAVLQRRDVWLGNRLASNYDTLGALSSGFPELDAALPGGGWPRGALVDLMHVRPGIGELAVVLPALAALTAKDEWVLLQASPHPVFAPAWRTAGVRLSRLIVVDALPEMTRLAIGDTLWAAEQVLRAGSLSAVLLWLPRVTTAAQLRRLQVAAEAGGTLAFLMQDDSRLAAASPAPLRLRLDVQANDLTVHLIKRRGAPLSRAIRLPLACPERKAKGDQAKGDQAEEPIGSPFIAARASQNGLPGGRDVLRQEARTAGKSDRFQLL